MNRIAAGGAWGTVEWAFDSRGGMPAREQFVQLPSGDQAKFFALFERLAEQGRISNREKFKQLGEKAGKRGKGIWEFKSFQDRFLGDFCPGHRFVIAIRAGTKKKDELDRADIERAVRILEENDQWERGKTP